MSNQLFYSGMTADQIDEQERIVMEPILRRNHGKMEGCAKYINPEENKRLEELILRRMINACLAYYTACSFIYDEKEDKATSHGKLYQQYHTHEEFVQIIRDQSEFFIEHATVTTKWVECLQGNYSSVHWKE